MNEQLAAWMHAQGLNNSQLAEKMGVSRYLVWRFASGERPVSRSFKWQFAATFGAEEAQSVFGNLHGAPEQVQA